jgi:hypothetical protein
MFSADEWRRWNLAARAESVATNFAKNLIRDDLTAFESQADVLDATSAGAAQSSERRSDT